MRWLALLIVPFVVLAIAALKLTQQPVLWNATEPGMTVDEVRAVLPRALPPAESRRLSNGLELKLTASGMENLERAFDAEFYFTEAGLQKVVLRPTRSLTIDAAASEFENLRRSATRRYGNEQPAPARSLAPPAAEARWISGRVTITLQIERHGPMGRITMSYSADPSPTGPS